MKTELGNKDFKKLLASKVKIVKMDLVRYFVFLLC